MNFEKKKIISNTLQNSSTETTDSNIPDSNIPQEIQN